MRDRRSITHRTAFLAVLAGLVGTALAVLGPAGASAAPSSSPGSDAADEKPLGCNSAPAAHSGWLYARCFGIVHTTTGVRALADTPPATALAPSDIRSAYQLPDGGDGQTVAIVDAYGYDNAEADLAAYRAHYGLPACTTANGCFRKVDQRGGTDYPAQETSWAGETALDLDAVSAACPRCHLLLVQGDDESFYSLGEAVDTAVALGATVVSNSYGSQDGEDPVELDVDHYYDHPGVAIVASTGDYGYGTSWPSTSPVVTGVGGTTLERDPSTTRGWTETTWSGAGSGCSPYELKPAYQDSVATGCDGRAAADVSAVADPDTGLAVYDTFGYGGWLQIGGTSLAAPLVAGMYALAGTPEPGTYPVSYPYAAGSALHDIISGANGGCGGVLCQAGPGWDGPTGLGTPAGVAALSHGRFGHVVGTVTDTARHRPVAGASVSTPEGYTSVTDEDGRFDLAAPAGSYDVTVTDYDYYSQTSRGVQVTAEGTTRLDFRVSRQPTVTLSGRVTDASGQGWPLYSRISIAGYPHGDVFTDPATGRYHVDVPANHSYDLTIVPEYPGYQQADASVTVGTGPVTRDLEAAVDGSTCTAAGYAYDGPTATFDTTDVPTGWNVTDDAGTAHTWSFGNPNNRADYTGGDGRFAMMDSWSYGAGAADSSLVSPVADLSGQQEPTISFDTDYEGYNAAADVDVSVDGGATWQTVSEYTDRATRGHQVVAIPQAADQSNVRVRFRYHAAERVYGWWELDNVVIGDHRCVAQPGGLVVGQVRDRNTGGPVHPAEITIGDVTSRTIATSDDPDRPDGLYRAYVGAGRHVGRVSATGYAERSLVVEVRDGAAVRADVSMAAGRIEVRPGTVSTTVPQGRTKQRAVTLTNTGTAPATVTLDATSDPVAPTSAPAARSDVPAVHLHGDFSPLSVDAGTLGRSDAPATGATGDGPWQELAAYPTKIMDNAVAEQDGTLYSLGGVDGFRKTPESFRYDPATHAWSRIADLPEPREGAAAAVLGGRLYVTGGESGTAFLRSTLVYDSESDSWSPVADAPVGTASHSAGHAVLGGQLYLVGGCVNVCGLTAVRRYDAASDTWQQLAPYPVSISHVACGGIAGKLYCAGGTGSATDRTASYAYDPATDTWSPIADLPEPLWGSAYTAAGGQLIVAGGIGHNIITNATYAYDPVTDSWSDLPPAPTLAYRGGSACGLVRVGGSVVKAFNPISAVEQLPGYRDCDGKNAAWLTLDQHKLTLAPGERVTVTARLDSGILPPGSYRAELWIHERTPYAVDPVDVTMRVSGGE